MKLLLGPTSGPRSNGPRVSRVARTRDRSTYAERAAGYVGCTQELDGVVAALRSGGVTAECLRGQASVRQKLRSSAVFDDHLRSPRSSEVPKLKISHRLIFSIISLITSSVLLSTFFSVQYFSTLGQQVVARNASTLALERELAAANAQIVNANNQMAHSLRDLDALTQHLIREQRSREQQLADMKTQYETLKVLGQGQEKIAEAHRAILQRRTWTDRLLEIGLGFSMGVLSSLVASFVWLLMKSKPMTAAEVDHLHDEEP